jgi:hypothetical protein
MCPRRQLSAAHKPFGAANTIRFLGFFLLAFPILVASSTLSKGASDSLEANNMHVLDSGNSPAISMEEVNQENCPTTISSHIIHSQGSKETSTEEAFSSLHETSSRPRTAEYRSLKCNRTWKIPRKQRVKEFRQHLTLDATFGRVGESVVKRTQTGEEEVPSLPTTTQDVVKESRSEKEEITLKSHDWELLDGHIDRIKLNQYRSDFGDSAHVPLILHEGNRAEWRARIRFLATGEEFHAFFEHLKPDFNLGASFKLYNFLIERSLSDQIIWWSDTEYVDLERSCNFDYDAVHLTIQIGDLVEPYISLKREILTPKEIRRMRNKFFDLFKSFKQTDKSYNKKWSTGPGKIWLRKHFAGITEGGRRYVNLIRTLGSESTKSQGEKEVLSIMSKNLEEKKWSPSSWKFIWLYCGWDVDEMEELICILEAFKTCNAKPAYHKAAQALKHTEDESSSLPALPYSAVNMLDRFVRLHRSLSSPSTKRSPMLAWICDNVWDYDVIYESILNIGKYNANTTSDRFRFSVLLITHQFSQKIKNFTQSIFSWIQEMFGTQKIGSIFQCVTPKI